MKTRKRFMAFVLTLVIVITALIPNGLVFAADKNLMQGTDGFYYTLDYVLSEDKNEETVTLTLQAKEDMTIQEVILPDGDVVAYMEQPVTYTVTENEVGNFTVKYIKSEVDKPLETETATEAITEETTVTELQTETSDLAVQEVVIPFEVTDISQSKTNETEAESETIKKNAAQTLGTEVKANATVTTLDELNAAIANAADGDTITVDGKITGVAVVNGKKITLAGGTLQALNISTGSEVTLQDITIDANKLGNNDEHLEGGTSSGGAAIIIIDSVLNLHSGTIIKNAHNKFFDFGALLGSNFAYGGGISVIRSTLNMYNGSNIIDNIADAPGKDFVGGAGIFLLESTFNMYGGIIQNNFCVGRNGSVGSANGGGVDVYYSTLNMYDGKIKNNTANYGGGIALEAGKIKIHGGEITDNRADEAGGAIAQSYAGVNFPSIPTSISIDGETIIQNNTAGVVGGAIFMCFDVNLAGNVKIQNNFAKRYGGGIYYEYTKVEGGLLNFSGHVSVENNNVGGVTNNIEIGNVMHKLDMMPINLAENFTGRVGITNSILSPTMPNKTVDIIVNNGANPSINMVESKIGTNANFFSDNPDYITRLEKDGENNKVVLGFPKITYNTRGGDFAPGEEQEFYTTANQPITKPSDPTFTDHAFITWYTTPDYQNGTEFDFNTPITKDTDLYARWFPDVYFIDFDANGGTGTMDTIVQDGIESVDLPANVFTNGAYLFDGWNTEADGSGTVVTDGQTGYTPGKKDVTLYAQWKERTYIVKYDTGGGTPTTIADKDNVKFDEAGLLPPDVIKKEGYTLTGWKVQGTDTKVENDTKYSDLVTDYTISEVTLEAQWSENAYTVKYDTNGGTPTAITDKTNVKFKDTGLLPADDPTRPGYIFDGWEVAGNQVLDTTAYKALVADDTVKSVTLVAQWKDKEYTVKYDSNGGTPVNVADKEHVKFWDAGLLPADTMTKPGYTFGGWNYNTKPVSDTTKYSDLAADDTVREMTLVAQWTPKQYTIHYDVNGGTPDNYPSEIVGFESVVPVPAAAPTKDGYDFKGWLKDTTKIDGTSVTYDSLVADDTVSEITLVAQWEEKSFTVKFELKPGERGGALAGNTADQSVKYNQYAAAGADVTVSVDSAFLGWSYSYTPVGSTTPISGTVMDYTTVPILNDVTFMANFAIVPFVSGISTNGFVSVKKGGAPADAGTDTITKIEYDVTETLPAKAGFKFEGVLHYHIDEIKFNDLYNHEFTLDLDSTEKQEFAVGEDGHTSNIQITVDKANGTVNITGIEESLKFNYTFVEDAKYTVSFKEETDSVDNWGQNTDLYTGDEMGKEPATNPVKPGYTFNSWSSDGSNSPDKIYDPAALVAGKDEVYYAVWTPKEYTVHYNTGGGTTVPDKIGVHYTDTGLTPADNPTKPGYTFTDWEKDTVKITVDTAYNTLVADDTVMEVSLTAKWEIKHFTASWVTKDSETLGSIDGGNQKEEDISYNGNVTKDVTAVPASNDSEFIGWEYSYIPDGSTTPVTGFTNDYKTIPVLGDITFTAKFASKPFVSIGATHGKATAAKGTTPEEISGSSGTTALIQYTAAEDIENNKGKAVLKYAADMHHHLTTISFKDMLGHEYTIWTKDGGGTTAGPDYEVGGKTPATKVHVVIDEKNGTIQISNIDTSLAFAVVFEEDPKYKVEFFRDKDDPASLMQTNDGLYTGNPVGAKPDADPSKPGYTFLGWSTDGANDPDKMYNKDTRITDADIAYYGVWELIDYKLTISKIVDGEYGNKKQDFHFTITLKDKDGMPLSGTYTYTGEAIAGVGKPGDGTMTLDAEGKAGITLRHGQTIILDGLHIGEQYTIEETEGNQNGYVTTATGDRNPNITGDCEAAFTNTRTTTPPTGIGPMNHFPTLILGVVFLLLTGAGIVWARRRRGA